MKKLMLFVAAIPLCISCTTSTQMAGTVTGASFGSILGSSIGGLMGGPRGSDMGTIVGMIAGAAVGNAATAPRVAPRNYDDVYDSNDYAAPRRGSTRANRYNDDTYTGDYNAARETTSSAEDIQNYYESHDTQAASPLAVQDLRFVDDNRNQSIQAGESCKLIFEIMNRGNETVYDVVPYISEESGNKHLSISPTTRIESIAPGYGVRYTATIKADSKLGSGTATFRIAIAHSTGNFTPVREFQLRTSRK